VKIAKLVSVAMLAVAFLAGCLESKISILVKKDGSGTVTNTITLPPRLLGMVVIDDSGKIFDEVELKKAEGELGEGVKFVSVEELAKKADGSRVFVAVYSFEDIGKVKFSDSEQDGMLPYVFKLEKGEASSKLTITLMMSDVVAPQPPASDEEEKAQEKAQIKDSLGGAKMMFEVKFDGEITKADASYYDKDQKTVQLMDMDFDKAMANPENTDKILDIIRSKDFRGFYAMKDIPGVKFEKKKVEVEFK